MIKFSEMSENAFRLAQCAKGKLPNGGICDSIMDLIEYTYNAGDDIEAVAKAKYNFKIAIDGINLKDRGFSADLYNSLIEIANHIIIDNKNIYAYMVYIIRLAKLINDIADALNANQLIVGTFSFNGISSNATIAYNIILDIEEKICYNSRIAQIYYVINNYDALLQYERRSDADNSIVWGNYKKFLSDIYGIVSRNQTHNALVLSKIEDNIIDFKDKYSLFKSYRRIHILKNIVNAGIIKMVKNICAARKDAKSHGVVADAATIMRYIDYTIDTIDSNITLSEMNECSYLNYYISDYINKIDNSGGTKLECCSETYRSEFISNIQCIVENNDYVLSEFDAACLNAIMVFETYAESCGNYNYYHDAISELRKLLKANSIDDVNTVTEAIRNLIPSGMVNKSINISTESEAEETEKCAINEESDEKNENTDDPSKCSERIKEISTPVSEIKEATNSKVGLNMSETHLLKEDKEKWNEPASTKPISWNEYFMELAETAAKRSKDPRSKVGACIMDPRDNRVVSLGYNGFPYGCSDDEFPWSREGDDNKYLYVVHAELNAILSARRDLDRCVLFVTYSPCNECMKAIIQSGIKAVVYKNEYKPGNSTNIASIKMAKAAGVAIIKYNDLLETGESLFNAIYNSLLKNFEHESDVIHAEK